MSWARALLRLRCARDAGRPWLAHGTAFRHELRLDSAYGRTRRMLKLMLARQRVPGVETARAFGNDDKTDSRRVVRKMARAHASEDVNGSCDELRRESSGAEPRSEASRDRSSVDRRIDR